MKHLRKFKIGTRVKSRYRAPWIGTVVNISETQPHCVYVLVDTDRCGRQLRKPILKHISIGWLEEIKE